MERAGPAEREIKRPSPVGQQSPGVIHHKAHQRPHQLGAFGPAEKKPVGLSHFPCGFGLVSRTFFFLVREFG